MEKAKTEMQYHKQLMSDEINDVLRQNHVKRGFKDEDFEDGNYTKLNGWELNRIWLLITKK